MPGRKVCYFVKTPLRFPVWLCLYNRGWYGSTGCESESFKAYEAYLKSFDECLELDSFTFNTKLFA